MHLSRAQTVKDSLKASQHQFILFHLRGAGAGASSESRTADEWFERLGLKQDAVTADEMRGCLEVATDKATVLEAIGVETVEEAVAVIFECTDANKDGTMSVEKLRRGFGALKMRSQLCLKPIQGLVPHDFSKLWHEKKAAHLPGTREWAFAEIVAWLETITDAETEQLFWFMGGGGTGKSVLTAELLHRVADRVVAWHFCRHDNPQQSAPSSLLRSLAAMLCYRLPGYAAALGEAVPAETVTDPKELFAALFEAPLKKVPKPNEQLLIILDALDELPKEGQKPLLAVIAGQLSQLPPWLKLFVTSREEPQIKTALSKFKPRELRADEAKNRADVEVFLRDILGKQVDLTSVRASDIELDVKREYGIDMQGKLAKLQGPMDKSKAIYTARREKLSSQDGYNELLEVPAKLNSNLMQESDEYEVVFVKQAPEAQAKLMSLIADTWEADPNHSTIQHPVEGTAREWVEFADSPGIKTEPRVSQKMRDDYGGHANKLKDLARLTLRFTSCRKMLTAIHHLEAGGFTVLTLKNKYFSPTPMGYSDFNLCVGVRLKDNTLYVCELQLNLVDMLEAKHLAHVHYEEVRKVLPALCTETKVDPGELEGYIVGRLSNSALDAAVAALSAKADGLFLYAYFLAKHLESEADKGTKIDFAGLDLLPAGLSEVYAVNFTRSFPAGREDPGWVEARPLVELIAAAREPISPTMAATLLEWDDAKQGRVLQVRERVMG